MPALTDTAIRAALRRAQTSGRQVSLRDPGPRGGGRLTLQVRPMLRGDSYGPEDSEPAQVGQMELFA